MNVTPLTTTRAEASAIILAGHAAKVLPAQNGLGGTYFAHENGKVCRCAIGLLYPEADARELEGSGADAPEGEYLMAGELIKRRLLVVPEDEAVWFSNIQSAHDDWTVEIAAGCEDGASPGETYFLSLLQ
jgi:hypothetical protein